MDIPFRNWSDYVSKTNAKQHCINLLQSDGFAKPASEVMLIHQAVRLNSFQEP